MQRQEIDRAPRGFFFFVSWRRCSEVEEHSGKGSEEWTSMERFMFENGKKEWLARAYGGSLWDQRPSFLVELIYFLLVEIICLYSTVFFQSDQPRWKRVWWKESRHWKGLAKRAVKERAVMCKLERKDVDMEGASGKHASWGTGGFDGVRWLKGTLKKAKICEWRGSCPRMGRWNLRLPRMAQFWVIWSSELSLGTEMPKGKGRQQLLELMLQHTEQAVICLLKFLKVFSTSARM